MAKDSKVTILYRMAEKSNKTNKKKPWYINNQNCFLNMFLTKENSNLIVFGDRLNESEGIIEQYKVKYRKTKNHGNCPTFLEILDFALKFNDNQIVYFVEDDYLHREGWINILKEGLEKADFVSLYDHPDKYSYEKNNLLFLTKSSHWKYTNSTTMTFATKVKNLKFTANVFKKYCTGEIPADYYIWNELWEKGYTLATPIPGFSTHGEIQWLSPLINWEKI